MPQITDGICRVIVPWDLKLETAKLPKQSSKEQPSCRRGALFTAMGGTPSQIAAAQFRE